jgi:hypothetical protein
MASPRQDFSAPDAAHAHVKISSDYARSNGKAMAVGIVGALWAASGVLHVIWPPGHRHHAVAQGSSHGLVWKTLQSIFQVIA